MAARVEQGRGRILDIERLRGYAILAVLCAHTDLTAHLAGDGLAHCGLDRRQVPFWLGVQLFFVISGYVVIRSFHVGGGSLWQFYLRRVARLWPTLLVFFAAAALANAVTAGESHPWPDLLEQWPAILLGVYNVAAATRPPIRCHGVAWSLSVEEQFYLIAPALVLLLGRLCRGHVRPQLTCFLGLYAVIAFGLRLALVWGPLRRLTPAALSYPAAWSFDFVVLGVALFYATRQHFAPTHWPRPVQRAVLYSCLLVPFGLMTCFTLQHIQRVPRTPGYLVVMAACGGCFFVVVGLASLDRQLLYVHRVYDRVLLYLGSRSYGIYLLHVPGLALAELLVPDHGAVGLRAAMAVLVWLPVVELVYRYVEQPGIRWGRRLIVWCPLYVSRCSGARNVKGDRSCPAALTHSAAPADNTRC